MTFVLRIPSWMYNETAFSSFLTSLKLVSHSSHLQNWGDNNPIYQNYGC